MAYGYKNALPLLSEEDVPGAASFIHAKLDKHSLDQLRRWLACRGMTRSGNKTALLEISVMSMTNTAPFARLIL